MKNGVIFDNFNIPFYDIENENVDNIKDPKIKQIFKHLTSIHKVHAKKDTKRRIETMTWGDEFWVTKSEQVVADYKSDFFKNLIRIGVKAEALKKQID